VRVQVSRVDLDGRKIDFRLVREGEVDAPVARKRKGAVGGTVAEELKEVQVRDRAAKAGRVKAVAARGASAAKKSRGAKPTRSRPKP
jgi:ribonuclease R